MNRPRQVARALAPVAVSALLLTALTLVFDPAETLARLSHLSSGAVAASCLALLMSFSIGALRFERAARRAGGGRRSLVGRVIPLSLFTILLAHGLSLASEAVRMHFLVRRLGADWKQAGFIALADRAFGLGASALLAGLALAAFPHTATPLRVLGLAVGLAGLAVLIALSRGVRLPVLAGRLGFTPQRLALFVGSGLDAAFQLLVGLGSCAALGAAIFTLALDLGAPISVTTAMLAAPMIYTGISVPFTFAGWGAREATHLAVFSATGLMAPEQAIALSLALGACIFAASLPGLAWLLIDSAAGDVVSRTPTGEELQARGE